MSWRNWPGRWGSEKFPVVPLCAPAITPTSWPMRRPIVVPELGEAEPILNLWLAGVGEHVYAGDRLVELLVDEATFDVAAPVSGKLVEQAGRPGHHVHAGQILGHVEEEE